jgi:hypothetical protein
MADGTKWACAVPELFAHCMNWRLMPDTAALLAATTVRYRAIWIGGRCFSAESLSSLPSEPTINAFTASKPSTLDTTDVRGGRFDD